MDHSIDSQRKAYGMNEIRLEHPSAYKAWTPEEDSRLLVEYRNGKATKELARIFQRQTGAISSRLAKLLGRPEYQSGPDKPAENTNQPVQTPHKDLREAILAVIKSRPPSSLTLGDVARLLIGLSESKRIRRLELYKHPYFGMFPHLRRRDIRRKIENMILRGEIVRGTQDGLSPALKRLQLPRGSPQGSMPDSVACGNPAAARENVSRPKLCLTQDQRKAQEAIFAWFRQQPKQVLTLGGYAGTGKTTVIAETVKHLNQMKQRPHIAFCCYTGKAADILRWKIINAGVFKDGDYCGTIHGLIYEKVGEDEGDDGKTEIVWKKKWSVNADLLVIDEASMVSKEIWNDLCSYGIPVLAVGDHGQLPPVGDKYNLMENPDVRLEVIHRQAQESPIVKLSLMARTEGRIPLGQYGPSVVKTRDAQVSWKMGPLDKVMFLCGRNKTRVSLNAHIRERLGIQADRPVVGDRVICLRNSRRFKVFNGMLGLIESIKASGEQWWRVKIKMDSDILFKGRISRAQFGQERTLEYEKGQGCLFDWGYALTVHKAQGSEALQVVLFEERFAQMDEDQWRRWLYTGVTRASQELIVIGN